VVDWVEGKNRGGNGHYSTAVGIGLQEEDRLIAGVVYCDYSGTNINMHVAAEGKRWMTREYLHFCFAYPFWQLKVKRVTGLVSEGNKVARKFNEHLGFRLETSLADAEPDGALLVYVMYERDCRWLALKDRYENLYSGRVAVAA
jgi:RimJ/RimL family protein N-acetyltransferase